MKKIFISGISKGIGAETAKKLQKKYEVYGSTSNLQKYLKNIDKSSLSVNNIVEINFNTTLKLEEINLKLNKLPPDINVLINNAGIAHFSPFLESSLTEMIEQMNINFYSAFILTKQFLPSMVLQNNGLIINILSVAALKAFEYASLYSATKSAMASLFDSIREEVRDNNIKITNIYLGATNTELWDEKSRIEFGKQMIKPAQVAKVIDSVITLSQEKEMMLEEIVIRPQYGDL